MKVIEKVEYTTGIYLDGVLVNKFVDDIAATKWVDNLVNKGINISNYTISNCGNRDKIDKVKLLELILI